MSNAAPAKPWVDFPPLPPVPDRRPDRPPYPFQEWTIAKSQTQSIFGIGAATGLGKTFMSYEVFKRVQMEEARTRFIVLTNKSAALQFAKEHSNFYSSDLHITAIHDKMDRLGCRAYADTRAEAYRRFGATSGPHLDAIILNYALFRIDLDAILAAVQSLVDAGFRIVVVPDEATAFKKRTTITHRAVNELVRSVKPSPTGGKVVILTATMTKGKLEEIYGIFCAIELGHVLARDWDDFLQTFCICAASRRALVPRGKLDELYYFIVQNGLDGGAILGLKAFKRRFNISFKKDEAGEFWGHLSKSDLDEIRLLCTRHPAFERNVPDLPSFYRTMGVKFAERDVKEEPIITGYRNLDTFIERIAPYVVILTKTEVSDYLPSFVSRLVLLEHTSEQRRLIREIYQTQVQLGNYADWRGDLTDDADAYAETQRGVLPVARLTEQGHIRRALLDPRLVHKQRLDDVSSEFWSPKTEELIRFLRDEASGERVIVYCPSKAYLKLLVQSIRRAGGLEDYYADPLEVHGDVSAVDREAARERFQTSPNHRLILINDAGIESINLQEASILYVMGLPRSGGDMIQLAGRPSRLGSRHKSILLIYSLISNSQDEDDYDVIQRQMQLVSLVQGEAEKGLLDHDRLRELDGIDEAVSSDDYRRSSLSRLLLGRRPRRMRSYGAALPS